MQRQTMRDRTTGAAARAEGRRSGKRRPLLPVALVLALCALAATGCSGGAHGSPPAGSSAIHQTRSSGSGRPVPLATLVAADGLWTGGVSHTAWTVPVEIDHGGLVVTPAPTGDTPKLPFAVALARFRSSATLDGAGLSPAGSAAFGYGVVTIGRGVDGSSGAPRFQRRLAWVGFAEVTACRGAGVSGTAPLGWQAVVMDAATGGEVVSVVPGAPGSPTCRGGPPTLVADPFQVVSIPWTAPDAVKLVIDYEVGCPQTFDRVVWSAPATGSAAPVQVLVSQPFDPGVTCKLIRRGSQPLLLPGGVTAVHGTLGPFAVYDGPVDARSVSEVPPQPVTSAVASWVHVRRWTLPAELDGGELTVTPALAGTSPTVPYAVALARFRTKMGATATSAGFGYGLVTITPSLTAGLGQSGLPTYDHRPAWIGFFHGPVYNCPMEDAFNTYPPPIAGPGSTPDWHAYVIDGTGGSDTLTYVPRGNPCNFRPTGPTVTAG